MAYKTAASAEQPEDGELLVVGQRQEAQGNQQAAPKRRRLHRFAMSQRTVADVSSSAFAMAAPDAVLS